MGPFEIVIDTNIIVSALKSKLGTSYSLVMLIGLKKFNINLSVPLIMEYEKVLLDKKLKIPFAKPDIEKYLDFICANANHHKIYYLWRPYLKDPKDDMVLELAVSGGCKYIVTFNIKDFVGSKKFGIKAVTPKDLLKRIGVFK